MYFLATKNISVMVSSQLLTVDDIKISFDRENAVPAFILPSSLSYVCYK